MDQGRKTWSLHFKGGHEPIAPLDPAVLAV